MFNSQIKNRSHSERERIRKLLAYLVGSVALKELLSKTDMEREIHSYPLGQSHTAARVFSLVSRTHSCTKRTSATHCRTFAQFVHSHTAAQKELLPHTAARVFSWVSRTQPHKKNFCRTLPHVCSVYRSDRNA